jgi:hypothetical protein
MELTHRSYEQKSKKQSIQMHRDTSGPDFRQIVQTEDCGYEFLVSYELENALYLGRQ